MARVSPGVMMSLRVVMPGVSLRVRLCVALVMMVLWIVLFGSIRPVRLVRLMRLVRLVLLAEVAPESLPPVLPAVSVRLV